MDLKILSMHLENFKGIKQKDISFNDKTRICGANATGKTSVFDGFTWLMFNKNSLGAEKFELRPLDKDGKTVNFVEIVVSAEILVGEEQYNLTKRQKQNWVKHRGSEEQEFQGNINEYEINGYPKTEKEFKAFISEIIDEDLFKLLSNPNYFTSLNWKKQREILMKLVQTESDFELAERLGGFDEIIGELKVASTDDIQKKWAKALKELKADQDEIPVRIDELERQKVDYDTAELELQKNALNDRLSALASEDITEMRSALTSKTAKRDEIKTKADMEKAEAVSKKTLAVMEFDGAVRKIKADISSLEYEIKTKEEALAVTDNELKALGQKYFDREKEEFTPTAFILPPTSEVCPMCGQIMPKEKIDGLKAKNESERAKAEKDFNDAKASDLKRMVEQGNTYKARSVELKDAIEKAKTELDTRKNELSGAEQNLTKASGELTELKEKPVTYGAEFDAISEEINGLVLEINKASNAITIVTEETEKAKTELEEVNLKLSQAYNNVNLDERITELKGEMMNTAQKAADCEKILFVLDNFVKAKMDGISAKINSCFEIINVRLFKTLINGGIEECCDITIDGVPFASLNNGARIVGGLDLIRTLSKIYGSTTPVFIDNAESVNDFNVPKMESQLIELVVTDDKTMKVEV